MTDEMEMLSTLVSAINKLFPWMTPEERVDVIAAIGAGYCRHCGYEEYLRPCQCENEE